MDKVRGLDQLRSTDFLPHLKESFRIRLEGVDPIDLELTSVSDLGAERENERRSPFSLQFLGPASNLYLRQHIYLMEHDGMGSLDLFIVPLGPEAGRMRYEAIFS